MTSGIASRQTNALTTYVSDSLVAKSGASIPLIVTRASAIDDSPGAASLPVTKLISNHSTLGSEAMRFCGIAVAVQDKTIRESVAVARTDAGTAGGGDH